MNLVICGGGSGGHITPNLAVASELKKLHPNCKITYILETNSKFRHILDEADVIDSIVTIQAGKFRRYHKDAWYKKLFDFKTNTLNLIDIFKVFGGTIAAWKLFRKLRPDGVLIKGGFVGVPVGLAARARKIPYITHDSDAKAGLTNRIVGGRAEINTVAVESDSLPYNASKVRIVGVPINTGFTKVDSAKQESYKRQIGLAGSQKLILITGGSLGAQRMNKALAPIVKKLLDDYDNLIIVHQTGKNPVKDYAGFNSKRLIIKDFIDEMPIYSGAADLVIARAGATQIAELASQAKPSVIIPNPELTGGHQLKNAEILQKNYAAEVLQESQLIAGQGRADCLKLIKHLLDSEASRQKLSQNIHKLARPEAAKSIAKLLLEIAGLR